jgi:hypothetical protein
MCRISAICIFDSRFFFDLLSFDSVFQFGLLLLLRFRRGVLSASGRGVYGWAQRRRLHW